MPRRTAVLWMSLLVLGCSAGGPAEPSAVADPASNAAATADTPTGQGQDDETARGLLHFVPASQIARPGEKPPYGLPLAIQIDVPEVPEHIRKPSGGAK